MNKILILVEGQTEETFVREVLDPYLRVRQIYAVAKLATTKLVKSGSDFKGGITSYSKTKNDILKLLNDSSAASVTTMIDFYGIPTDFPGKRRIQGSSPYERVAYLERKFQEDINHSNFLPYLQLHEFEAMMFVDPAQIARTFSNNRVEQDLLAIRNEVRSPEEIDEGLHTAPSKRLKLLLPAY